MSMKDAFNLGQAQEEIDNLKIELARYKTALEHIQRLHPSNTVHGYNEWGEADCWHSARQLAERALAG